MGLVQLHYRGRSDTHALNADVFDFPADTNWTQYTDRTFRVRFEVEEDTGVETVVTGGLEANLDGGSWFIVTATSGTVTAAPSERFADGDPTSELIFGSPSAFVTGSGSTRGTATAIALADEHTELEYALHIVAADTPDGGIVSLRVAALDAYVHLPAIAAVTITARNQVRLKVGDTDMSDPLLSDAEIDSCIAAWPSNVDLAAASAAEAIAAKFSRGFNFSTDGQVFNRRERVQHYMELSKTLGRAGYLVWPGS